MKQNGHAANVTISANTNTLKAALILENNYHVDFRPEHSICSLLGFNNAVYTSDYQESENPVNILSINSILVNIDIISGSYVNGLRNPTIYSFTDLLYLHKPIRSMRSPYTQMLTVLRHNLSFGSRAFRTSAPKNWNTLPLEVRQSHSLSTFRNRLKTFCFRSAYPSS